MLAELAVQLVGDAADASQLLGGQGLAQPAPQDGAQLVVVVEGEAVIDAVAVPALHGQDVVALAVGVVDDHVEHRHAPQRGRVLMDQDDLLTILVLALEDGPPARVGHLVRRDEVHGALIGVPLLPELHHPLPERAVAQPGARHDVPAEGLGDQEGGHFPTGQSPAGEVPERGLARHGLVHDRIVADPAQERRVRRRREATGERQLGGHQVSLGHQDSGMMQVWPSGSMG